MHERTRQSKTLPRCHPERRKHHGVMFSQSNPTQGRARSGIWRRDGCGSNALLNSGWRDLFREIPIWQAKSPCGFDSAVAPLRMTARRGVLKPLTPGEVAAKPSERAQTGVIPLQALSLAARELSQRESHHSLPRRRGRGRVSGILRREGCWLKRF